MTEPVVIEPEYALTKRQWLWRKSEHVWGWRGFLLAVFVGAAMVLFAGIFLTVLNQNRLLEENLDHTTKSVEKLDAFTKEFAAQNRLHRIDNHAENACALQLLSQAFRNNPLYEGIPLPVIEGNPCGPLTVTEEVEGLSINPAILPPPPPELAPAPAVRPRTTTAPTTRRSTATTRRAPTPTTVRASSTPSPTAAPTPAPTPGKGKGTPTTQREPVRKGK